MSEAQHVTEAGESGGGDGGGGGGFRGEGGGGKGERAGSHGDMVKNQKGSSILNLMHEMKILLTFENLFLCAMKGVISISAKVRVLLIFVVD